MPRRRAVSARKFHLESNRVRMSLPAPGQQVVAYNAAHLPPRLASYFAFVQLVAANGRRSRPVRAGQPLAFSQRGQRLFSVTLTGGYVPTTGLMRIAVKLHNFGMRKRTAVVADVTVGYRLSA